MRKILITLVIMIELTGCSMNNDNLKGIWVGYPNSLKRYWNFLQIEKKLELFCLELRLEEKKGIFYIKNPKNKIIVDLEINGKNDFALFYKGNRMYFFDNKKYSDEIVFATTLNKKKFDGYNETSLSKFSNSDEFKTRDGKVYKNTPEDCFKLLQENKEELDRTSTTESRK